jgi:hypothetical protein
VPGTPAPALILRRRRREVALTYLNLTRKLGIMLDDYPTIALRSIDEKLDIVCEIDTYT